jgi:acryloyl-coenzyme A reductase
MRVIAKGASTPMQHQQQASLPELHDGEVLVRVQACGVCGRDIIDRSEGGNTLVTPPRTLGHEVSGTIVAMHPSVTATSSTGTSRLQVNQHVVLMHNAACGSCSYCMSVHSVQQASRYGSKQQWHALSRSLSLSGTQGNAHRCHTMPQYTYGITCDGGYATHMVAHASSLMVIPESIRFEVSCFLFCTAAVALRAIQHHAQVRKGQQCLITGASGGVGLHAIQV